MGLADDAAEHEHFAPNDQRLGRRAPNVVPLDRCAALVEVCERAKLHSEKGMAACRQAIALINEDRAARGVPPLEIDITPLDISVRMP